MSSRSANEHELGSSIEHETPMSGFTRLSSAALCIATCARRVGARARVHVRAGATRARAPSARVHAHRALGHGVVRSIARDVIGVGARDRIGVGAQRAGVGVGARGVRAVDRAAGAASSDGVRARRRGVRRARRARDG
jgi:hypothetical protein